MLKQVRALQSKRERRETRLMVVEGEDLLAAALAAGITPQAVIFDDARISEVDALVQATNAVGARYLATADLIAGISTMATPPRVLAIVPRPGPHHFSSITWPPSLGLYLAGVSDPGNVGSLIRTASALGCDWVAIGSGSADAAHPRAVRGAMGATFTVPILETVRPEDLATREGFLVVEAVSSGGQPPWTIDLTGPLVLAMGAERAGLAEVGGALAPPERTVAVTIPQAPGSDSLNVGAAAAALLVEIVRQRGVESQPAG